MISELLSEVYSRVGHGLVLAWFESCPLHLLHVDMSEHVFMQSAELALLAYLHLLVFTCTCSSYLHTNTRLYNQLYICLCHNTVQSVLFYTSQSLGQEKHFGILFIPLCIMVHKIQLSVQTVKEIMADLACTLVPFMSTYALQFSS